MRQNLCLNFSFKQAFVNEILLRIVEETKEKYVFPLRVLYSCAMSFDLCMSKVGMDTFVFIAHFLNELWESCYIVI